MTPKQVSAVVVTRGDVDMTPVLQSLEAAGFGQILVCNNARRKAEGFTDFGPYGQFCEARDAAEFPVVYFQDDDAVVSDPAAVVAAWKPGVVICNMSAEYRAQYNGAIDKLMGYGSVFDKALIAKTLDRYYKAGFYIDSLMMREPGRLFTALNPVELVDVPVQQLPWATAPNRLYQQPEHCQTRDKMRERARMILEKEKQCQLTTA